MKVFVRKLILFVLLTTIVVCGFTSCTVKTAEAIVDAHQDAGYVVSTFTSCTVKTAGAAVDALQEAGYLGMYECLDSHDIEGVIGVLFFVDTAGLSKSELSDLDGDGFWRAKNFIQGFYFDSEEEAEEALREVIEISNGLEERENELIEDGDIIERRDFEVVHVGKAIFIGTQNAIDIAK